MRYILKFKNLLRRTFINWCPSRYFFTKDYLQNWGERVNVGDFTYGKPVIFSWGENTKLEIGKYCSIADGVEIFLGGNHRYDWITTYPFPSFDNYWPEASTIEGVLTTNGDVVIGNDVWICHGAIILSGVRIGDGAVIGAGAVVSKNVNPYSIVAGNPAKEIKRRFNDETIIYLLKIRWWDWPPDKVKENIKLLCSLSHNLILHELE